MDLDSIEAGRDFAKVIQEAVDSCAVLIALIGRQWATITDEEGRRRLENPEDYVRSEVQAALERGVRVIPVLLDGTKPLRQQQLPSELQQLARLNAFELSYGRYEYDADRLLNLIQQVLDEVSVASMMHPFRSSANVDARPDGTVLGPADRKEPRTILRAQMSTMDALNNAVATAQSITDEDMKAEALATIVEALAATDPDGAERIARSITDKGTKAEALATIVEALAATDPDGAERIARSITGKYTRSEALATIVEALAATDPDGAERIARSITDKDTKAYALATIVEARLAAADPDDAER